MKIQPAARLRGQVSVPGDKSISHRAAIIAAMAEGSSLLANYSTNQDCASTLSCLGSLGVGIQQRGSEVRIDGRGARGLNPSPAPLDCGNSGSTMRMLAGVLSGQAFGSVLTGDTSLRARPMKRIVEPLVLMGARVHAEDNRPPLRIEGSNSLKAIRYELPVASAQVKSCILLAALNAEGRTEVIESLGGTRDHTERMLRWFGVPLETSGGVGATPEITITISGPAGYAARDLNIPGDISSAAFLIGAAALLPGSELRVQNVGLNATRVQALTLLSSFGFDIEIRNQREDCNEPLGDLVVKHTAETLAAQSDRPHRVDGPSVAQLIDELPLLAVIGSQLAGGLEIRDAAELRMKETDRIAATVTNLRAMGAAVDEFEDGLAISGPTALKGAQLNAFGDHRIAMAFSVAALLADHESEILGADCVAVSFPGFFDLLSSVVER
jgi:3-phosphoshikimate 1-carboxyvinyltransferase